MDEESPAEPRFRFFSLTFLVGFGVGTFIGVALGLMAFLFVDVEPTTTYISDGELTPSLTASPGATPVLVRTSAALEVRIGPGTQYAAMGTIARGEAVDVVGRDSVADWVAIRFPPGSSARGWLPASALDNMTNLYGLNVVAPTPLPRSVSTPIASASTPIGQGTFIVPTITSDDGVIDTPVAGITATVAPTRTPAAGGGMPDLAVTGVSMLADGRVRVTVTNRGADLEGFHIFAVVTDPTTRSESLRSNGAGLRSGASVVLESSTFIILEPTNVSAIVDPSHSIPDANRGNNSMSLTLGVVPTPTPTPFP